MADTTSAERSVARMMARMTSDERRELVDLLVNHTFADSVHLLMRAAENPYPPTIYKVTLSFYAPYEKLDEVRQHISDLFDGKPTWPADSYLVTEPWSWNRLEPIAQEFFLQEPASLDKT